MELVVNLEKLDESWVNPTFIKNEVYAQRHGYDTSLFEQTKIPLNHNAVCTNCCDRMASHPSYKGLGNCKIASKFDMREYVYFERQGQNLMCRCHVYEGNVVDCPVHETKLASDPNSLCAMFGKKNIKKIKETKRKLRDKFRDIQKRLDRVSKNDASYKRYISQLDHVKRKTIEKMKHYGLDHIKYWKSEEDYLKENSNKPLFEDNFDGKYDEIIEEITTDTIKKTLEEFGGVNSYINISEDEENSGESDDDDDDDDDESKMQIDEEDDRNHIQTEYVGKRKRLTYVPFETESFENYDGEPISGKKRSNQRSSNCVFKYDIGMDLVPEGRKLSGRYFKSFSKVRKCFDEKKATVVKKNIFAKNMMIFSSRERSFKWGHCNFCWSFVKMNQTLYKGNKYMCENCWYTRPEGCFEIYDRTTQKISFVTMEEMVSICSKFYGRDVKEEFDKITKISNSKSKKHQKKERGKKSLSYLENVDLPNSSKKRDDDNVEDQLKIDKKDRKRAITPDLIAFCINNRRLIKTNKHVRFTVVDDRKLFENEIGEDIIKVVSKINKNKKNSYLRNPVHIKSENYNSKTDNQNFKVRLYSDVYGTKPIYGKNRTQSTRSRRRLNKFLRRRKQYF